MRASSSERRRRSGLGNRSGLTLDGCSDRSGDCRRGGRRELPRIAGGLLHLLQPLRDRLGFAHRLDLAAIHLERQLDVSRVVLLHDLVVAMVIGRPEEFTGNGAPVDHLEVSLGRVDFDLRSVEELAEMFFENVTERGSFVLERNAVRNRDGKRRGLGVGSGALGGLVLNDGDEAVVLTDDHTGDLEELVSAARGADGLGQRGEAGVLRIERNIKEGADVGTLFARGETALTRTSEAGAAFATGTARAALGTTEITTGSASAGAIAAGAA